MSSVALALPLVTLPAVPLVPKPPTDYHFATPPWDRNSPEWQRLDAKLPPDHLARRIDQAVDGLNLTDLFKAYAGKGSRAHRPDLLLKVVLYEIQRKHSSPAQWYEDLLQDDAC